MKFVKATKKQAHARVALVGVSGAGKTYSALRLMRGLVPKGRIALIDSERGSASKYSDKFDFDAVDLVSFSPLTYVQAIEEAAAGEYAGLIIDSLSHAWMGRDGALEQVDRRSGQAGGSFGAWRDVTPMQNKMIDALVRYPGHVIATMRSKAEFVVETIKGKPVPRKVGMAPVQRDGLEYEFDVVVDLNHDCSAQISKTRCSALTGQVYDLITEDIGETLRVWLTDGVPMPATPPVTKAAGGTKLPDPPAKTEVAKPQAAAPFDMGPALLAIARAKDEAELRALPDQVVGTPSPQQVATLREVGTARLKELRAAAAAANQSSHGAPPPADHDAPPPAEPRVERDPEPPSGVIPMPDKGWTEFLADVAAITGADTAAWTEDDVKSEYSATLATIDKRSDLAVKAGGWLTWVNKRSGGRTRALRPVLKDMYDQRQRELRQAEQGTAS